MNPFTCCLAGSRRRMCELVDDIAGGAAVTTLVTTGINYLIR